jgi:polysaccharide export outer membrane protein
MTLMIRLRILAALALLGLAAFLAGCTDRAPLAAPAVVGSGPYELGAGDKLRVVVYDQPSLTNIYEVSQTGNVSLPLVGDVPAAGSTAEQLGQRIRTRLAHGYIREPDVTVEVATYRPFFVLGEVGTPGQYPYVPGITAETAVAVAGGFTDRANRRMVRVSRTVAGKLYETRMPVTQPIRPGDTIYVPESLF